MFFTQFVRSSLLLLLHSSIHPIVCFTFLIFSVLVNSSVGNIPLIIIIYSLFLKQEKITKITRQLFFSFFFFFCYCCKSCKILYGNYIGIYYLIFLICYKLFFFRYHSIGMCLKCSIMENR